MGMRFDGIKGIVLEWFFMLRDMYDGKENERARGSKTSTSESENEVSDLNINYTNND